MRVIRYFAVLSLLGTAVITATTEPAAAGASGCQAWGGGSYGRNYYAQGSYCVTLAGQGRYVQAVGGSFGSAGNVCNWQVTAEFFDTSGRWYQTFATPVRNGCMRNGNDTVYLDRYMRAGRMCSSLRSNGTRITSVCHSIY